MEQFAILDSAQTRPDGYGRPCVIDVRALANIILDEAESQSKDVTNMALNKIAYFVHCDYLLERSEPLVGAKIEAWQHGPVFREVYHEFKRWDDKPIRSRATKIDANTGEAILASAQINSHDEQYIRELIRRYVRFSAGHLRAISHAEGGPWHRVWGHDGRTNPGMRISDDLIRTHYSPGVRQ